MLANFDRSCGFRVYAHAVARFPLLERDKNGPREPARRYQRQALWRAACAAQASEPWVSVSHEARRGSSPASATPKFGILVAQAEIPRRHRDVAPQSVGTAGRARIIPHVAFRLGRALLVDEA
jgi:hypothetical protein